MKKRTEVAIIGGGPSGLLLSQLLHLDGIDTVVLERRSRDYVMSRIRAGVLESGTVELLRRAGVGRRMDEEGFIHHGTTIIARGRRCRIDFEALTGRTVMVYGQTEATKDLYAARDALDGRIIDEVCNVALEGMTTNAPAVSFRKDGVEYRLECDFICGCDVSHGISRAAIPANGIRTYEQVYPFSWLGILSETPPTGDELIYVNHERGLPFVPCAIGSSVGITCRFARRSDRELA